MDVIADGSDVLVAGPRGNLWLMKVRSGGELYTHLGVLKHDSIIGLEYGSSTETSKGYRLYLMRPFLEDYIMKGERRTQIVYPKDMGLIAVRIGVRSGSRVLEIGTGSGALTMFLADFVAPTGRVYSYEARREFADAALRNLRRAGLAEYVEVKVRDASGGVEEREMDSVVIDIGDPCSVMDVAHDALRPSGGIAVITPTYNQVEVAIAGLRTRGFIMVEAFETTYRRVESRPGATRPASTVISHTAFIVTARKTLGEGK